MKKLMAWSLVVAMVFVLAGCGSAAEVATPTDIPEPETEDEETGHLEEPETVSLASFYPIEHMRDMAAGFSFLEYSFSAEESELTICYDLVGPSRIGDTSVDQMKVTMTHDEESSEMELWMDAEGNTLKLVIDGEDAGPMAPMMAEMLLMIVVSPFALSATEWEDAFVGAEGFHGYGWTSVSRHQTTRNLGAGEVLVHQYRFQHTYENQTLDYHFEVAEIGDYSMFVAWEVELETGDKANFRVHQVIPR